MKKRIGIQGTLIFLVAILAILLSKIVFPSTRSASLDEFLDCLGICLVLFGFLFRIAARGYKQENSSSGNQLVKNGPYSLTRNPMYFGTFLIGTGIISILFAFWVFPVFIIIFSSIYVPQIKREDKVLTERFKGEYKDYCKTTPRFIPKIKYLFNLNKYIYLKLSWIKKELPSLAGVAGVILLVEIWEDFRRSGFKAFYKESLGFLAIIISFVVLVRILFYKRKS